MGRTIHSFLEESALKYPKKAALIHENKQITYEELNDISDKIRNFFVKSCEKGDRIALLLDNSIEMISFYFGVLKSGCVAVLMPSNISDDSMGFQVEDCKPKYLIYEDKFLNKINRLKEKIKHPIFSKNTNEEDLFADEEMQRDVAENDISTILYTSGTTSFPKGVKLQHLNVVSATKNINEFIKNNEKDIYISGLPLSHSFGLGHIHVTFLVGGTAIIENNFINIRKVMEDAIKFKATIFASTPATLKSISDNYLSLFKKCGDSFRMIISNTGPIQKELIQIILDNLSDTDFYYYYGLTEASRSTFINYRTNPEGIGSVGKPSPNTKIEIRNGEICISGNHIVKEYWNNKEASEKIKNGWIFTGDTGYFDNLGYLHLTGRVDDIINVNGEKVMPEEIENIARKMPGVSEAAAVGMDDSIFGQSVSLYAVTDRKAEDIHEFLKDKLERYKLPKRIFIVNSIPKTDSGKLKRSQLR